MHNSSIFSTKYYMLNITCSLCTAGLYHYTGSVYDVCDIETDSEMLDVETDDVDCEKLLSG